jgi:predicted NUDIX family NTP pyrophosphohydrolase
MAKVSAGVLMYRWRSGALQVLLVHPGGPFWAKKDLGAWSIPKGEVAEGEDPAAAARREMEEETGVRTSATLQALSPVKQKGGKTVMAWAVEGDGDSAAFKSNTFTIEWPPRSGRMQEFPEVDRAEWFSLEDARRKLLSAQLAFVDELERIVGTNRPPHRPIPH